MVVLLFSFNSRFFTSQDNYDAMSAFEEDCNKIYSVKIWRIALGASRQLSVN